MLLYTAVSRILSNHFSEIGTVVALVFLVLFTGINLLHIGSINHDSEGMPTVPQVGKNTMLELLYTNQIKGFKIGSRWKIKKESVVVFLRYK